MKLKMFSIFDVQAQAYLPPFWLGQTAMAIRIFSDCVNSDDHQFGKHPGDYTLFELGTFDDSVCVVSCTASAVKLVNGLEVVDSGEFQPDLDFVDPRVSKLGAGFPGKENSE